MSNEFYCPICGSSDFQSLDYLRLERYGFCICRGCGFETYYPSERKYQTEEELLDFYRYEYRRHPSGDNIITTNRKLGYIQSFLHHWFIDPKNKGKKFLDIGCATGYFLNYLKMIGHDVENLYGTEYTVTFANFAKNFYGIKHITEDPKKDIQYDYIHLIHVLEHMHEPDKKLLEYRNLLKDDGYLMIAVPVWHDYIFDTAKRIVFSFDDLYHPNHVNTWSKTGLRNLLKKTGWDIVHEDGRFYGLFVLCKKGEKKPILKENYLDIVKSTENEKLAIQLQKKKQALKALEIFPNYPDAIVQAAFFDYKSDFKKQCEILEHGINTIPDILDIRIHYAHALWQWKQYEKSLEVIQYVLKIRPNDDLIWDIMAKNYVEMKKYKEAAFCYQKMMQLNPQRFGYCSDILGNVCSQDWSGKSNIVTTLPVDPEIISSNGEE